MITTSIARRCTVASLALAAFIAGQRIALADLPQAGDLVFGLSNASATLTTELVRGTATMGGGTKLTSPWQSTPFIEVVKLDNLGGVAHNAHGNLLGVDFGTAAAGGQIFSFATSGSDPAPTPQLIVDTGTTNSTGMQIGGTVSQTRLGEIAVSPDNTKILATGYDAGSALVYDYVAGNSMGTGTPAASGGRESAAIVEDFAHTVGAAWKNNSTGLVFSSLGNLYEINATTMAATMVKAVDPTLAANGNFTSLTYNPSVSPYIYATYGGFDAVAAMTLNKLYVLDPANSYNVVKSISLSTSLQTARDSALDASGNLFLSQFGGTGTAGASIDFLPAANVLNPSTLTDNSSVDWYTSSTLANFSGLDIGFGTTVLTGDYNGDGKVNAPDYVIWRKTGINGAQGYSDWRTNFGNSAPGSGSSLGSTSAVPEPASMVLIAITSCWMLAVGNLYRRPRAVV